jgi:hypothetical protein
MRVPGSSRVSDDGRSDGPGPWRFAGRHRPPLDGLLERRGGVVVALGQDRRPAPDGHVDRRAERQHVHHHDGGALRGQQRRPRRAPLQPDAVVALPVLGPDPHPGTSASGPVANCVSCSSA